MIEKELTKEEIDQVAELIEQMDHYEMCRVWRFAEVGDPRLSNGNITSDGRKLGEIFSNRLFKYFGGFTPEISKNLGWEK